MTKSLPAPDSRPHISTYFSSVETLAALPIVKVPVAPVKKAAAPRKPSKKRTFDEPAIGRRVSSRLTSWGEDGTALSREERQKALEDKIEVSPDASFFGEGARDDRISDMDLSG